LFEDSGVVLAQDTKNNIPRIASPVNLRFTITASPAFGFRIKHDPQMMDQPRVMHKGKRLQAPEARLFEKAGLLSGTFL